MIPKISVRPAASMNSSSPYCTLLRSWIRKLARSIRRGSAKACCWWVSRNAGDKKMGGATSHCCSLQGSAHLAAGAGIGQRLGGHADHLVFLVLDDAQVHVLHRVVRFAHRPLAA